MKSRLKLIFSFVIGACIVTLPAISHAQAVNFSLDQIQIYTNPETPVPGRPVTISIESFNTDLNGAAIVWIVDGKTYTQGTGKTIIQVTAPAVGKTMTVQAVIRTVEGREVRKVAVLKPGGVDLVWESQGFVPPFYKGKALFAYQNQLKVSAVAHFSGPNNVVLDPKTLLYKWTVNDRTIQDQSGFGKQTITLQESLPKEMAIKVEVSTRDGNQKAAGQITLSPLQPSVSLYADDPLYGVLYNKALTNNIKLTEQEITLRAVPYSFNVPKTVPLNFLWSINNLERNDLSTAESITLRTKGDTTGSSRISIEVKGAGHILQSAENEVTVQFTKKKEVANSPF